MAPEFISHQRPLQIYHDHRELTNLSPANTTIASSLQLEKPKLREFIDQLKATGLEWVIAQKGHRFVNHKEVGLK